MAATGGFISHRRLVIFYFGICLVSLKSYANSFQLEWNHQRIKRKSELPAKNDNYQSDPPRRCDYDNGECKTTLHRRRDVLVAIGSGVLFSVPSASHAGEVGARINRAVTQSDLGIAVRQSVVRGAQVIDQIDGKWEQFSDRYGLGSERSKQPSKPSPKVIPDPLPLNAAAATDVLEIADNVFLGATGISRNILQDTVRKVSRRVKPSFERAFGVMNDDGDTTRIDSGSKFNFQCYVHFRAFTDLLMERDIDFPSFKQRYEREVGQQIISLLVPTYNGDAMSSDDGREAALRTAMSTLDQFCEGLRSNGFVATFDRSDIDPEKVVDWLDDMSDLELSVALDGDITMGSQILLQEQGFRLYPGFVRFAVSSLLQTKGLDAAVDDYYMDTDYNSDPDKYEAKEVLLNIVLS